MIYIDSHSFFEENKQFGCSDSEFLVTEFPSRRSWSYSFSGIHSPALDLPFLVGLEASVLTPSTLVKGRWLMQDAGTRGMTTNFLKSRAFPK